MTITDRFQPRLILFILGLVVDGDRDDELVVAPLRGVGR